ncbi:acyl-CoA dehydrogenase [Actinoplanes sp. ATCC 53533]|uniref:acyl-CoA dehydrogenase family protein n=1 Tax=Actinoplanes sp. ATCC 53533 TaxID=1288362 RepID=UPI000F79D48A|nr:acyl-CoA dehydrogenase family protein [Actinoplanes sp. ATCC 53533]RSM60104.1 acyl-CoA dehydrogenase [Actinoplanes sp. ATCC 53533]
MRLTPSPEQAGFRATLHDLLTAADVPSAAARWADGDTTPGRAIWSRLAAAGVTGLIVPERWGGAGAGAADLVIACEELGHHALPGPVAESIAAVPALLAALADDGPEDDRAADKWLPELAAGRIIATLAAPPWLPRAADADATDLVLLAEPGVVRLARTGAVHASMDPTRRLAEVSAAGTLAAGPATRTAVAHALNLGALACAAQLLGAGHALLEAAVAHAKTRSQFGRPVGSFQALQHRLADVAVGLEFARPLLYAAATAISATPGAASGATPGDAPGAASRDAPGAPFGGAPGAASRDAPGAPFGGAAGPAPSGAAASAGSAARDVSAAKVACGEAAHRAARAALQVHGAIGYTREHGLGRWLTKVRVLTLAWGTPAQHRARVMAELTR